MVIMGITVFFISSFPLEFGFIFSYSVLIIVLYLLLELMIFERKQHIITVVGMIVLIGTLITFLMGWWNQPSNDVSTGTNMIDSKTIFIVSILSIMIVIGDLVVTFLSNKKWVSRLITILWVVVGIFVFILLVLDSSLTENHLSQINTDLLTILALSFSLITIGLKNQLHENHGVEQISQPPL